MAAVGCIILVIVEFVYSKGTIIMYIVPLSQLLAAPFPTISMCV